MAKKKTRKKVAQKATKRSAKAYCKCCGKLLPTGMSAKKIADLYKDGKSTRQIAAIAGVHQSTVHDRLKAQGVKLRRPGAPKRK